MNKLIEEMGSYLMHTFQEGNDDARSYVTYQTQTSPWQPQARRNLRQKMRGLTLKKLRTNCLYAYLRLVLRLILSSLRDAVLVQAGIGERHRWMYDEYALKALFETGRSSHVRRLFFSGSGIRKFAYLV